MQLQTVVHTLWIASLLRRWWSTYVHCVRIPRVLFFFVLCFNAFLFYFFFFTSVGIYEVIFNYMLSITSFKGAVVTILNWVPTYIYFYNIIIVNLMVIFFFLFSCMLCIISILLLLLFCWFCIKKTQLHQCNT